MKLLEIAKRFGDGFKEGWNGCQSDDKTEWQEDDLDHKSDNDVSIFETHDTLQGVPDPFNTYHINHSYFWDKE